jgi:hypothetical protein
MNCGKPMSAGSERSQISPGSHECASMLAQISGVLPSKSAARPSAGHDVLATAHSIAVITFFTIVGSQQVLQRKKEALAFRSLLLKRITTHD